MIIGRKYGLDPAVVVDILNVSTGRNFSTERSMQRIIDKTCKHTFKLGLFTKDVKIAADMADHAGVAGPIAQRDLSVDGRSAGTASPEYLNQSLPNRVG